MKKLLVLLPILLIMGCSHTYELNLQSDTSYQCVITKENFSTDFLNKQYNFSTDITHDDTVIVRVYKHTKYGYISGQIIHHYSTPLYSESEIVSKSYIENYTVNSNQTNYGSLFLGYNPN